MHTVAAIIDRRILLTYAIDPDVARAVLPAPFRPDLSFGPALGGICLLRLRAARPVGLPAWTGLRTETTAHRMAVEWDTPEGVATGVYVFRRDSDSGLATVFSTAHRAEFGVLEGGGRYSVAAQSRDGAMSVAFAGAVSRELPAGSVFAGADSASAFFHCAAVGHSPDGHGGMETVRMDTPPWLGTPLRADYVQSGFFEDRSRFPQGSATFDSALLMTDVPCRWTPVRSSAGTCPQREPAHAR